MPRRAPQGAAAPPPARDPSDHTDRPAGNNHLSWIIAGAVAIGILSVGAVCAVWLDRTSGPFGSVRPGWLLCGILLVATVAAEALSVPLRHDEEQEALTLFEAAVIADVLLLPPAQAALITSLALALASVLDRRVMIKSVFNLGCHATATAGLITVVTLIGGGPELSARLLVGLVIGALVFAGINLAMLAQVLRATTGVPPMATIRETWRLSSIMAIGGLALGAVTVVVGRSAPALLPATLLPALALRYAFRTAAEEAEERARSGRLVALSQVLAGRYETGDLLSNFLSILREAFPTQEALVIFEGDEEQAGRVAVADDAGVWERQLTATDAALLSCVGDTAEFLDRGLPDGWGRTLIAPLDAEGLRLGILVLAGRQAWRPSLVGRDLAVLTPLVSALAVALRGAEHHTGLIAETSKLKAVVDHSSDGILVLDSESRVVLWSPAMTALTGVDADLAAGRRLGDIIVPAVLEAGSGPAFEGGEAAVADALAGGFELLSPQEPHQTLESAIVRPDGEQRWIRAAHAAVFGSDGQLRRDVVLVHDVTRERLVDRMKADFIATVSHELRTPLTPIKGYTDLLRRKGDSLPPQKRQEMLDTVADRVAHLGRLVEDLLLASRVSSPASAVRMGRGDLAALTAKVVEDFSTEAARITVRMPPGPVDLACDPTRVVQVVANLVSNAFKYSGPDAPVTIEVKASDERACVVVTDAGRGVPADHLERIFDKFHRVEDPMVMTTGGTGLGLFISRQLAEGMGGTLTATSTLGEGSTFTFCLPLHAAEQDESAAGAPAIPVPQPRSGRPLGPRRAAASARLPRSTDAPD